MEEEVEFNYFYNCFIKMFHKEYKNEYRKNIKYMETELMLMLSAQYFTKEKILEIYDKCLYDICTNYLSLSNSKMYVLANSPFELIVDILNEIEKNSYNPYRESLLTSLQFIYQNYLECLEVGIPILFQSENNQQESYMEITVDSNYRLSQFDFLNMSLLEQTKTMTHLVMMEKNKQIGPLPKVKYYYRKDI